MGNLFHKLVGKLGARAERQAPKRRLRVESLEARLAPALTVVPPGLKPGDKFHVVFVSSETRNANDDNFGPYDSFVQGVARSAGVDTYDDQPVTWKVLGSTQSESARTRFSPTVPVFRLDGTKVANNGTDLWDGSLQNSISVNEKGEAMGPATVHAGTSPTGQIRDQRWLGGGDPANSINNAVQVGNSGETDSNWIDYGTAVEGDQAAHFYAFSSVLTVPNEPPVFTSSTSASIAENTTFVQTLSATDKEPVSFSISGGADAGKFAITSGNRLSFRSAPDYEANSSAAGNNTYSVTVRASDGIDSVDQTVTVSVTNVPPEISGGSTASKDVPENFTGVVARVVATNSDNDTMAYSLDGGADASVFDIDLSSGELSFKTPPDYERPTDAGTDNSYAVVVKATSSGGSDTQTITVNVTPVNEFAPVITSGGGGATAARDIPENLTPVTTVTATDEDRPNATLTYSIANGADRDLFTIDSSTGALSFLVAPDYEAPADANADNVYDVVIQVSDGEKADTQAILISVTPVNDNDPVITSGGGGTTAARSIPENSFVAATVTATDADRPKESLKFSIVGGADAVLFTINPNNGALTFREPPDFEAPTDASGPSDNVYEVVVQVSDGLRSDTQAIALTVTNVIEDPVNLLNGFANAYPTGTQSVDQDGELHFTAADNNLLGTRTDDFTDVQVKLAVAHGTLSLSGTAGLSFTTSDIDGTGAGDGTGDRTMTFRGAIGTVNAAIEGLTYRPDPSFSGADSLTIITTNVGGTLAGTGRDSDVLNIVVHNTVDDAPTIDGVAAAQEVIDTDTINPFRGVVIGDPDSTVLTMTVKPGSSGTGAFTIASLTGFTPVAGGYRFVGSVAGTQEALRGLVFKPAEDQVAPGGMVTTNFSLVVSDGVNEVADSTTSVLAESMAGVSTLPFADAFSREAALTLGGEYRVVSGGFNIVDGQAVSSAMGRVLVQGANLADVAVESDISLTRGAGQYAGLAVRVQGLAQNTYYLGAIDHRGSRPVAVIYRIINGHAVVIARKFASSGTGQLRFEAVGNSLKLYMDGTLQASARNSRIIAPGAAGLWARTAGLSFDNFRLASLSPVRPSLPFAERFDAGDKDQLGPQWSEPQGNIRLTGVSGTNNSARSLALLNGISAADVELSALVTVGARGHRAGVVARADAAGKSYYQASIVGTGDGAMLRISRIVAGQERVLASQAVADRTGVLNFRVVGNSLSATFAGGVTLTASDNAIGTGTVGIRGIGSTAGWDDFSADGATP